VKKLAFGAVLVLALVAAGCGGGGGGTLSKEEYSTKLNEICADLIAKSKKIGQLNSPDEAVAKGPELADAFQKAIDQAKKLKPPAELEDAANRFVSLARQLHDKIDEGIAAAKKQNLQQLVKIGVSIDTLSKEAEEVGTRELNAPACRRAA
jgi:hypothetical protein